MRERTVGAHVVCAPDELELCVTELSQVSSDVVNSILLWTYEELSCCLVVVIDT